MDEHLRSLGFYYLRVVVMFTDTGLGDLQAGARRGVPISYIDGLVLASLSGLLLWIGLYQEPPIRLVRTMEKSLLG